MELNAPPGATIATLGGAVFALAAVARALPAARAPRRGRRRCWAPGSLLALGACGSGGDSGVQVVATTTQVGDWARQIKGDGFSVHQILKPNTDPHEYEPRPDDVEALASAPT